MAAIRGGIGSVRLPSAEGSGRTAGQEVCATCGRTIEAPQFLTAQEMLRLRARILSRFALSPSRPILPRLRASLAKAIGLGGQAR